MSGYESPTPEDETAAPSPENMLADGSAEAEGSDAAGSGDADGIANDDSTGPRSSGSREEPPRETSEATGLVSPGSTADGAGTTT